MNPHPKSCLRERYKVMSSFQNSKSAGKWPAYRMACEIGLPNSSGADIESPAADLSANAPINLFDRMIFGGTAVASICCRSDNLGNSETAPKQRRHHPAALELQRWALSQLNLAAPVFGSIAGHVVLPGSRLRARSSQNFGEDFACAAAVSPSRRRSRKSPELGVTQNRTNLPEVRLRMVAESSALDNLCSPSSAAASCSKPATSRSH